MRKQYWLATALVAINLFIPTMLFAQDAVCRDTAEHQRLRQAMWEACGQDNARKVYDACKAYQKHADMEGDLDSYYNAWVCGIVYNLDRMNIRDAYHIVQSMKTDLQTGRGGKDEQFLAPNMLGQVYNACGNVNGAAVEFEKAVDLIKGTRYEATGLSTLYLGLAHIYMNSKLSESMRWIDEDINELNRHKELSRYYRGLANAYAFKAMLYFKLKEYDKFRQCQRLSDESEAKNQSGSTGSFRPYLHIYQEMLEGQRDKAHEDAGKLQNQKDRYIVWSDLLRYEGDYNEAFKVQRRLMHIRDSITGIMIAENIENIDDEMRLMKKEQEASRRANIILTVAFVLAVLLIVALLMNILNRRRFQKALLAKNDELREANRRVTAANEMKTEFIRSVSHEIRTPLNIINGFTEVLTEDSNSFEPGERKEIANTISTNTRQITSLVNKMLALANENSKDLLKEAEETDGITLCHRAIQAMPPVDPKRVKVEFLDKTQDGNGMLCTNEDSLLQMLGNLLENSVKFTEEGSICLILSKDDTFCHFTVEDTGCGIQKDKVDHIFERFIKGDEFKEGLGIGLAYCHETAQKLGGRLTLDHTSDEGTSLTLCLPIKLNKNIK